MSICRGCDGPQERCQPLWPQRKCCPDCTHTPAYAPSGMDEFHPDTSWWSEGGVENGS